jgi:hypothetical protein
MDRDDAVIVQALEVRREVAVPEDFAARVMGSLPELPVVRPRARVGRAAAMVAAGVVLVAVFALAPHARPEFSSLSFDLEMVLLAELAGIGWWVGVREAGVRG